MSLIKMVESFRQAVPPSVDEETFNMILDAHPDPVNLAYEIYKDQEVLREMLLMLGDMIERLECLELLHEECDE